MLQDQKNTSPTGILAPVGTFFGEWYHVYNRGANKMPIFRDSHDWDRFQKLLYLANNTEPVRFGNVWHKQMSEIVRKDTLVDIATYTLMDNHFHILLKEKNESTKEIFLRKLCTAYTMYYNKKYKHSGVIFEGNSKSKHVVDDTYFQYLTLYIHLNPLKYLDKDWKTKKIPSAQAKKHLEKYSYSSYIDFFADKYPRDEKHILAPLDGDILNYFTINPVDDLDTWISLQEEAFL